jgi:hypothetical protein
MVLAFLRAEYYSPLFKALIRRALGGNADLLHRPRLDDAAENRARKRRSRRYAGTATTTTSFEASHLTLNGRSSRSLAMNSATSCMRTTRRGSNFQEGRAPYATARRMLI